MKVETKKMTQTDAHKRQQTKPGRRYIPATLTSNLFQQPIPTWYQHSMGTTVPERVTGTKNIVAFRACALKISDYDNTSHHYRTQPGISIND